MVRPKPEALSILHIERSWHLGGQTIYQFKSLTMRSMACKPTVSFLSVSVSADVSMPSLLRGSKKCSWRNWTRLLESCAKDRCRLTSV